MTDTMRERLASAIGAGYLLEDELHGGGMSRVFVARDLALDRRVVVKVLAPERAGVLSAERFRKEALMAASLQHPHIVPIIAAGEVDGVPYLMMPFVDGRSLRDRIERDGRLPIRDAVRILLDVSRACVYAHARGVVHRDIKPDNVLMSGDAAMITDFGVALAVAAGGAQAKDARLTQEGYTVGSPRYMAPEQAAGETDIDQRADIYAFGILAYELLAGVPPFNSTSAADLLRSHLTVAAPDIRLVRPEVEASLAELIDRCLEKRREDRPENASAVVSALEAPGIVSSSHARPVASKLSRKTHIVRGALVACTIAAVGLFAWRSRGAATPARDSIAVLPVIDRTSDSTSEWMATGLTDEVTAVLGRVAGLRVAARRSVERFRSDTTSAEQIAHALGVATILDATLTRIDSTTFQLAAQLVEGKGGLVLWSASIRGARSDVAALQDSVVNGVLHALGRTTDTTGGGNSLEDPAARRAGWAEYLKGRQELRRRGTGHLREAISHFAAALSADAMLPQAYTGLADAWSLLPLYDPKAGSQPLKRALDAVDHALTLDPKLPEARASRGHILAGLWQWKEAEADLRAALDANPALVDARQWLGELLLITGRSAEAVKVLTAARTLDPTSPVVLSIQGFALAVNGQSAEGSDAVNAAIRIDETFAVSQMFGGAVQLLGGHSAAAITLLQRAQMMEPSNPLVLGLLGQAYGMAGDTVNARAMLATITDLDAGIPRESARAHVFLGLRDTTAAFTALERAIDDREPLFASEPLGTSLFALIRNSPHFAALLEKIGFTAEASKAIRTAR